jgi:hypothetical protein
LIWRGFTRKGQAVVVADQSSTTTLNPASVPDKKA